MSSQLSGPVYRAAGMSYLRYANICADLMRNVLKEPLKAKAQQRQVISYKFSPYADGKQGPSTIVDLQSMPTKAASS